MLRKAQLATIMAFSCMIALSVPESTSAAEVGDQIEQLSFKDIRYLPRSLGDFGDQKAYVLFFTNTKCPLVQRYMPVLMRLDKTYRSRGVQFIAVNVGPDDTIREMASHALKFGALFPFVKDTDGSMTEALGVERTPEVVVLDENRKLVYRGRIDSQYRLGGVNPNTGRADLEEAIKEVIDGDAVSVAETRVDGCKITLPRLPEPSELITYTKHVAHTMKKHCQSCHRGDTAAPFGLGTYDEVAGQGEMVAEVVMEQRMPPWYASSKHGKFKNERLLTRDERTQVAQWVATGMTEGDPEFLPEPFVVPTSQWEIGKPDLVITMSKSSTIPAIGYVPYEIVALPYMFLHDTWIEAFEIKPNNPRVVHHCNAAYGTIGGKTAGEETFITGYVPGGQAMDATRIASGVAYKIPARSVLGLQIHNVTTGKKEKSEISVGMRFAKGIVRKQLRHAILDAPIQIPPHHSAWRASDSATIDQAATILGLFSHKHLRGKDTTFYSHEPTGKTRTLLQIPNYNFDWQMAYELHPGDVRVPAGTKIEAVAHYDNSSFNPYNPDPTRTVPYGQQTYDEMLNAFVFYTFDDENLGIEIDPKTGRQVAK